MNLNDKVATQDLSPEDKALLAELNGTASVSTPAGDAAELKKAQEELKRDPLAVDTQPGPLARKATEAKRENPAIRGYAITVEGEYYAASVEIPGKKMKKSYSILVNLPSIEGALSVIKHKLLDKMLKMKYTDYAAYRTHEITSVKPLTPDTPTVNNVMYMDLSALISFISAKELPVSPEQYDGDVRELRAAVADAILNPKDFKKREARRLADIAENKQLAAMNRGIEGNVDEALRG